MELLDQHEGLQSEIKILVDLRFGAILQTVAGLLLNVLASFEFWEEKFTHATLHTSSGLVWSKASVESFKVFEVCRILPLTLDWMWKDYGTLSRDHAFIVVAQSLKEDQRTSVSDFGVIFISFCLV